MCPVRRSGGNTWSRSASKRAQGEAGGHGCAPERDQFFFYSSEIAILGCMKATGIFRFFTRSSLVVCPLPPLSEHPRFSISPRANGTWPGPQYCGLCGCVLLDGHTHRRQCSIRIWPTTVSATDDELLVPASPVRYGRQPRAVVVLWRKQWVLVENFSISHQSIARAKLCWGVDDKVKSRLARRQDPSLVHVDEIDNNPRLKIANKLIIA